MAISSIDTSLEALRQDAKFSSQLVETLHLPPDPARFGTVAKPLPDAVSEALSRVGISRLYSHQVEALEALRRGENALVTTPTSSGKSLIFYLPVIEEALRGGDGKALFLFPLKALGQDQKGKYDRLATACGLTDAAERAEIYDGDTPRQKREEIRGAPPRVVISNPDMLHLGILPSWPSWGGFLRRLEWIVLDELHVYRGIFGSHFHHVLGRLLRLCALHGGRPKIVASSATVANAVEFAETLTDRAVTPISDSGSPREGRHVLLFQPQASPYTLTLQLLIHCLESDLKTIVFTKARRITELLYSWLARQRPDLADRVASYRSGFLPSERREIEGQLFDGRLDGVISTSALEMGIDVGGLDACILVGYPGSVMATWQRSGRVGRADRDSMTALVALPDALDQYLLQHPLDLISRPFERLIVDPTNRQVARAHLICAAAEQPLDPATEPDYCKRYEVVIEELKADGELLETEHGTWVAKKRRPQRQVSLRGPSGSWAVVDQQRERVIGTVNGGRVFHECHPGAVYLHAGKQYLVGSLDHTGERALAESVRLDYFTRPLTEKETDIVEVLDQRVDGPLQAWLGRLLVTERVIGYERRSLRGQELIDRHSLELPPMRYETVGLWWAAPPPLEVELRAVECDFMGSLHAAEHAAISLFPLLALCDRNDIGGISIPLHPQLRCGGVFIYDGHPGGVGIAARGFSELPTLLGRVVELLENCDCESGCPSCVHSPKCGNGNRPLDKRGALESLRMLLGQRPVAGLDGATVTVDLAARRSSEAAAPSLESLPPELSSPESHSQRSPLPSPAVLGQPDSAALEPQLPASTEVERLATRISVDPTVRLERPPVHRPERPHPAKVRDTVLFDLETQRSADDVGGWNRSYRMRVAIGVTCHLEEGRFEVFEETGVERLIERLESADLVIGFNSARFDYEVLSGYTGIDYLRKLPTLDLLEEVERVLDFRLSLNHLAKETLGVGKSADGLESLEWFRQGRLDLIEEYCRQDVAILRDLYLYGRRMSYLWYRDKEERRLKVPVDW